jgi:hypothetical protein
MRHLPDDFRDFLSILNEEQVEYLIVGGWALGVHGYVRATGDMDIWVGIEDENIGKLISSLEEFGVPGGISKEFFMEKGNALRMGMPPMRIEVITEASGIDFPQCYLRKIEIEADGVTVPFIAYEDLVRNKRSSGRLKDLADLEGLGEKEK